MNQIGPQQGGSQSFSVSMSYGPNATASSSAGAGGASSSASAGGSSASSAAGTGEANKSGDHDKKAHHGQHHKVEKMLGKLVGGLMKELGLGGGAGGNSPFGGQGGQGQNPLAGLGGGSPLGALSSTGAPKSFSAAGIYS